MSQNHKTKTDNYEKYPDFSVSLKRRGLESGRSIAVQLEGGS